MNQPRRIWVSTTRGVFGLKHNQDRWEGAGVSLLINSVGKVTLESSADPISGIELVYGPGLAENAKVLGDAWERSYGTLHWANVDYDRIMPWYFAAFDGKKSVCWGVNTGCNALASWRAGVEGVHLLLDLRSGNRPLILSGRSIELVTVHRAEGESPFSTVHTFLKQLCPNPRLPSHPVNGANDWYYAYGNNTAARLLEDSKRVSDLASNKENRPFSVIDDGWQPGEVDEAGPASKGNERFPDMPKLAHDISEVGCQPGIWIRPLQAVEKRPDSWLMAINSMDPSVPEVLDNIRGRIQRLHEWGYKLIKHDYSTYDVTSLWGFEMTDGMGSKGRTYADQTRTTAEILLGMYHTIRAAAGSSLLIGCNTVSHLSAGLFEIQRIGDDTSGQEWARTVKMGVNTLAFRAVQQDAFYEADADCVGLTTKIAWEHNRQWLDLVSRSGTPLFVSAQAEAVGEEQKKALKRAFELAAVKQPIAEPLDWMESRTPSKWKLVGEPVAFDWH